MKGYLRSVRADDSKLSPFGGDAAERQSGPPDVVSAESGGPLRHFLTPPPKGEVSGSAVAGYAPASCCGNDGSRPPGTASWGRMLTETRSFMVQAWWMIWLPGIALMVVSLTGNLMGDWLRDALDPRLRNVR